MDGGGVGQAGKGVGIRPKRDLDARVWWRRGSLEQVRRWLVWLGLSSFLGRMPIAGIQTVVCHMGGGVRVLSGRE